MFMKYSTAKFLIIQNTNIYSWFQLSYIVIQLLSVDQ